MTEPKHYLITGGAGFIGSHLIDALLPAGHRVTVLDNLATGQQSNVDRFAGNDSYEFVHGSILDELIVDELTHAADVVVHLAAAVGVKLIVEQPLRSFVTNVRGSENVIGAAQRYNRKIMVASTSEVYGKNESDALNEESDRVLGTPSTIRWSYSTAKAVDEILANLYHQERGLPTIITRFFNTVGPRQSPAYGMVIPRFIQQALAGDPIQVFGDGEQTRCFAHVHDVVRAVLELLDHEGAIGGTFNIGSPFEISMNELAQRIKELSGSTSDIVHITYDQAYAKGFEDMRRRVPDTSRLNALTGWTPEKSLDEILNETIASARAV
ncbi:MAG: GDP-mannose 4,6-dehydratase [Acidimicrobiia bacterium]